KSRTLRASTPELHCERYDGARVVKLHHATTDSFVFQLNAQEKELFLEMLQLYPLVHAQHHRLTKSPDAHSDENQRLLEESLAEHRAEKKQMVNALLAAPERFQKHA